MMNANVIVHHKKMPESWCLFIGLRLKTMLVFVIPNVNRFNFIILETATALTQTVDNSILTEESRRCQTKS